MQYYTVMISPLTFLSATHCTTVQSSTRTPFTVPFYARTLQQYRICQITRHFLRYLLVMYLIFGLFEE